MSKKHEIENEYTWVRDNRKWNEFVRQQERDYTKLDDLTYGDLKKIKKMISHNVTINEMRVIVFKISDKFNLSPKDSFVLWQNKCYI